MRRKCLFAAAALLTAAAALAQAPDASAERNAKNWDVLHQMYPARAVLAREEGLVGFKVKIDAAGTPTSCQVTHSSGHPLLDQETCQLIISHATFKRPEGSSLSQERSYDGVVNWKLPTTPATVVPAAPTRIAEAAAPDKIICKRTPKVGSNAAFERTCMTETEWKRTLKEGRETWEKIRNQGYSCRDGVCDTGH